MFIPSQISEFGHKVLIYLNVFTGHPALVAKGFMFFLDKSFWFKNVLIAGTGLYHHTGVPSIISSYLLKSMPMSCISGKRLLASLFCSSFTTVS